MVWLSDSSLLKGFKNQCPKHKHTIITNELTFYGFPKQPDFAEITIKIVPNKQVVELMSVKKYLVQFRNVHISYEGILDVIYKDFKRVYRPLKLYVRLETNPRGGIGSVLEKGYDNL